MITKAKENVLRVFGARFSKGEIISWIVRSFMLPMVLLFAWGEIIPEKVLDIVIGVHLVLWMFLVPVIIENIVDGK